MIYNTVCHYYKKGYKDPLIKTGYKKTSLWSKKLVEWEPKRHVLWRKSVSPFFQNKPLLIHDQEASVYYQTGVNIKSKWIVRGFKVLGYGHQLNASMASW